MGEQERLRKLKELARADCSVLLGRPLTASETRIVDHTADLCDAIATNIHEVNHSLTERLARCLEHCEDDPPQEMSVVA